MSQPVHHPARHPSALPSQLVRCALLALATLGSGLHAAEGVKPLPGTPTGLRLDGPRLNALIDAKTGLCTGQGGDVSACNPRPQPKWDLDKLKVPARVDLSTLKPQDRPDWVVCRVNHQEKPPRWECAEIYTALPR